MKLLGVNINFNKNYPPAELEELEHQFDAAFGRFARRMFRLCLVLIVLAVVTEYAHRLWVG